MKFIYRIQFFILPVSWLAVSCVENQIVEVSQAPGQMASESKSAPIEKLQPENGDLNTRLMAVTDRVNLLQARLEGVKTTRLGLEQSRSAQLSQLEQNLETVTGELNRLQTQVGSLSEAGCRQIIGAEMSSTASGRVCVLPRYEQPSTQLLPRVLYSEKGIFNCAIGESERCGGVIITTHPYSGRTYKRIEWEDMERQGTRFVAATEIRSFEVPRRPDCGLIEIKVKAYAFLEHGDPFVRFKLKQNGGVPRIKKACEPEATDASGNLLGCFNYSIHHPNETIVKSVVDPRLGVIRSLETSGTAAEDIVLYKVATDGTGNSAYRAREYFVTPDPARPNDVFTFDVSHSGRGAPAGGTVTVRCLPQ